MDRPWTRRSSSPGEHRGPVVPTTARYVPLLRLDVQAESHPSPDRSVGRQLAKPPYLFDERAAVYTVPRPAGRRTAFSWTLLVQFPRAFIPRCRRLNMPVHRVASWSRSPLENVKSILTLERRLADMTLGTYAQKAWRRACLFGIQTCSGDPTFYPPLPTFYYYPAAADPANEETRNASPVELMLIHRLYTRARSSQGSRWGPFDVMLAAILSRSTVGRSHQRRNGIYRELHMPLAL